MPVLFVAGAKDMVLAGQSAEMIEGALRLAASDVRGFHLLPDAGHWIQQERSGEVNALLLEFLAELRAAVSE